MHTYICIIYIYIYHIYIYIPTTQNNTHILEDLTHKMEGSTPKNTGQMGSRNIYIYIFARDPITRMRTVLEFKKYFAEVIVHPNHP